MSIDYSGSTYWLCLKYRPTSLSRLKKSTKIQSFEKSTWISRGFRKDFLEDLTDAEVHADFHENFQKLDAEILVDFD